MDTPAQPVERGPQPPSARSSNGRPNTAGWLAIIVFLFLAGVGVIAALATVATYAFLSSGLTSPQELVDYKLPQETIVYDRNGVELARFGEFKREVVTYDQIPPVLQDATTAIEDKTFWENAGFDPTAIVAAGVDSFRGNSRGASTITQQLVRARLLDPALVQDPHRTIERKLKEIIQSVRVTQAFPGDDGKKAIIAAYLNQNYYGNQSYGVKAAARSYFGVDDLSKLTPAQAAILAALPKSPSNYDLARNAVEDCLQETADGEGCLKSRLVVPPDSDVVQRRNAILELMASGRTPMSGDTYSPDALRAAEKDEVVLAPQATPRWTAPHFVWEVRDELAEKLCGPDTPTCDRLDEGGLRVTTTLDTKLQTVAEKWVQASTIVPHAKNPRAAAQQLGLKYESWMANLRNKDVRNGALVAMDYTTGEVIAYVGSADYYAAKGTAKFQPKFDVAGKGFRQPGSAFKPFNYAVGIDDKRFTAGTMFMDSATTFAGGYSPSDADGLERGPVRVRNALQFSLNIPAVKAAEVNTVDHVFSKARDFGMSFRTNRSQAGVALTLGVQETPPLDLTTAYATLANGGSFIGHTTILTVQDPSGTDVIPPYKTPEGKSVVSPQASWIMSDILSGNTDPAINPYWGKFEIDGPGGKHRPATLKTGTNTDAKDLNAYGYIAPPSQAGRSAGAFALVVGAWNGNSDNTVVTTPARPVFSIDVTTYVWQGFLDEVSARWPITDFKRPGGLVQASIDPWTGALPASGGPNVKEWFIKDTEPKSALAADTCGVEVLRQVGFESKFDRWLAGDRDWLRRAERGPGVAGGPDHTRTSYFYNGQFNPYGRSWGPLAGGSCGGPSASPSCFPVPTPDASGNVPSFTAPSPEGSGPAPLPCPTEPPSSAPSESASTEPTATPTPKPTKKPTPVPTDTPPPETPTPTPTPTGT